MSETGYAKSFIYGLSDDIKLSLTRILDYVVPFNKFGPIDHQTKAINFDGFYVNSTSDASTGEFSILHGMGRTPAVAKVMVDLTAIGAGTPILRVSRVADVNRVYFKADAGSTSMPFSLYLE